MGQAKMSSSAHFLFSGFIKKNIDFEREREIDLLPVVPVIYASSGWFLYTPWLEIELATLEYGHDAIINWITWPGLVH